MYLASQAVQGWSLCQCRRSDSISATAQIRHIVSLVNTAAKSLQLCPILCDPTDGSPPGSHVPGILQARTLEWVAISFCIAWKWKVKVKLLSHVRPLATSWTAAYQAHRQQPTRLIDSSLPGSIHGSFQTWVLERVAISFSATSLELIQMYSFWWLGNIPLCICTTAFLSIHLVMGI